MSELYTPEGMEAALQVYPRIDGNVPFWDHPNFKATRTTPKDHKPLTRVEQALEERNRNQLSDEQIQLLTVLGQARCVNEHQLRRYMLPIQSASKTSDMLQKLQKRGYVHRYKASIRFEEPEEGQRKPPGIFVLGIIGFKLMQYLYPEMTFIEPDKWMSDSKAVQRYVALNEVRLTGAFKKRLSSWKWLPHVGGNTSGAKPFAIMTTKSSSSSSPVHFIVERAQMSQTFLIYLYKRIQYYRYLVERDGMIKMEGVTPPIMQAVVLSVSTVAMAEHMHQQLRLHLYEFDILFLIDEWIEETEDIVASFAQSTPDGIVRVQLPFF